MLQPGLWNEQQGQHRELGSFQLGSQWSWEGAEQSCVSSTGGTQPDGAWQCLTSCSGESKGCCWLCLGASSYSAELCPPLNPLALCRAVPTPQRDGSVGTC